MNQIEHPIDVRVMPPRDRHPTIFRIWDELPFSSAILLINDHDPLPLYYQFAAEFAGHFHWEYLEKGPEIWRVRISKGSFENPGFVPQQKKAAPCPAPIEFVQPFVLDVRPIFERGDSPCHAIDQAVATLIPGQLLVLLVPFEPVPLYAKLSRQGFSHRSAQMEDGTWRIEFCR